MCICHCVYLSPLCAFLVESVFIKRSINPPLCQVLSSPTRCLCLLLSVSVSSSALLFYVSVSLFVSKQFLQRSGQLLVTTETKAVCSTVGHTYRSIHTDIQTVTLSFSLLVYIALCSYAGLLLLFVKPYVLVSLLLSFCLYECVSVSLCFALSASVVSWWNRGSQSVSLSIDGNDCPPLIDLQLPLSVNESSTDYTINQQHPITISTIVVVIISSTSSSTSVLSQANWQHR